jgi:hypothetical protein
LVENWILKNSKSGLKDRTCAFTKGSKEAACKITGRLIQKAERLGVPQPFWDISHLHTPVFEAMIKAQGFSLRPATFFSGLPNTFLIPPPSFGFCFSVHNPILTTF